MRWPAVTISDERPGGKSGECFYCKQKIGNEHKRNCVAVEKVVHIKYIIDLHVRVPHDWDKHAIEGHRNDGSWCASNIITELSNADEGLGCLCGIVRCEYIDTIDDTPIVVDDDSQVVVELMDDQHWRT